jgi:hypothetical protein
MAGGEFEHDKPVWAWGAEPAPVVRHARIWYDRAGAETLGGLSPTPMTPRCGRERISLA